MAERQFIYIKRDGEASRPARVDDVMRVVKLRAVPGDGPFCVEVNGEKGPQKPRGEAIKSYQARLNDCKVGDQIRLRDKSDSVVMKAHRVVNALPVLDINGNAHSDVYYSVVVTQFKNLHPRFAGCYVCKDVAGTGTPSQHSYGNAVDFFFDSLAHQDTVADYMVGHADALHIEHIISRDRIWTRGQGWHSYTGEYHSHLHVDFDPQFSGPCGVREP